MKTVFCNKETTGTKTDAYLRENKGAYLQHPAHFFLSLALYPLSKGIEISVGSLGFVE